MFSVHFSNLTEEQVQAQPESAVSSIEKTEENDEAEVDVAKVVQMHSIGCGPSSDGEVEEIFTREEAVEVSVENSSFSPTAASNDTKSTPPSNSTKVSIGTSPLPLPQECGTQVS